MATIGNWVWFNDAWNNKRIAQVIGFESNNCYLLIIYPQYSGGQIIIERVYYDNCSPLTDEEMSNMPVQNAHDAGYELGKNLRTVFAGDTRYQDNPTAVFSLARSFATMSGRTNINDGFDFIEGFVAAFQENLPQQITGSATVE